MGVTMQRMTKLAAVCMTLAATAAACATRSPIKTEPMTKRPAQTLPAPGAPAAKHAPETSSAIRIPTPDAKAPLETPALSPAQLVAVLRVEAGALVTQINGDPTLACTQPACKIALPPGTHTLTVGYKDTATRGGSRVTYASMHPRVIEVTLEPGHTYSLTASGRSTPKWWIAIEDRTANKIVYNDRDKPQ